MWILSSKPPLIDDVARIQFGCLVEETPSPPQPPAPKGTATPAEAASSQDHQAASWAITFSDTPGQLPDAAVEDAEPLSGFSMVSHFPASSGSSCSP